MLCRQVSLALLSILAATHSFECKRIPNRLFVGLGIPIGEKPSFW